MEVSEADAFDALESCAEGPVVEPGGDAAGDDEGRGEGVDGDLEREDLRGFLLLERAFLQMIGK